MQHTQETNFSRPVVIRKEREIEQADFEVKLRQYTLDLIQPTIRRSALMEQEFGLMKEEMSKMSQQMLEMGQLALKVELQIAQVAGFQEDMSKWDNQRLAWQASATESLAAAHQDLDTFRHQLERQDASIYGIQRTTDRVVGELARVQSMSDSLREHVEIRLSQTAKMASSDKTDIEMKLVDLEARHNRLSDDFWGEETGLSKVVQEVAKTNDIVSNIAAEIRQMRQQKASITQLQAVQEEVNVFMQEANGNVASMKQMVDTMMSDVKQHFKTATNTVAAHNAAMIQEVRASYQEELNESAKLRAQVLSFMNEEKINRAQVEENFTESQLHTEELCKKVCSEVEEVGKLRRRDRNTSEVEIKSLHEQLATVRSTSQMVASSLETLSSVLWMVVQSERASSALDLQDNDDRARIALFGFREQAPPVGSRSKGRGASAGGDRDRGDRTDRPGGAVINVDQRCLSCSGQAPQVMSGFKMACLQYMPGPVSFARRSYDRGELCSLRERLLHQAHEALQTGPLSFEQRDVFGGDNVELPAGALAAAAVASLGDERPQSQNSGSRSVRMPPLSGRYPATAK